jgi:hypothetical protein
MYPGIVCPISHIGSFVTRYHDQGEKGGGLIGVSEGILVKEWLR